MTITRDGEIVAKFPGAESYTAKALKNAVLSTMGEAKEGETYAVTVSNQNAENAGVAVLDADRCPEAVAAFVAAYLKTP